MARVISTMMGFSGPVNFIMACTMNLLSTSSFSLAKIETGPPVKGWPVGFLKLMACLTLMPFSLSSSLLIVLTLEVEVKEEDVLILDLSALFDE